MVFEKSGEAGGIWLRAANRESRVQVDPVSYAAIEDPCPVRSMDDSDVFDNFSKPTAEVCIA